MLISYHGCHCGEFCGHAQQGVTLQEVVAARISRGFTSFGLTEHMPRDREAFLYPEERAAGRTPEGLRAVFTAYLTEAKRLRAAYPAQELLVGFETEYCDENYPAFINRLREESAVDYIVGSVHHVAGIPFDYSEKHYAEAVAHCGGLAGLYQQYYAQQLDLIEQCRPEVIGHFDLIKIFSGSKEKPEPNLSPELSRQIDRNIAAVLSYGGIFEVNSRAFAKGFGEPYPGGAILRRIREMGGDITLGDDSHGVDDIGIDYSRAVECIKEAGFEQIVALRKREGVRRDWSRPMAHLEKIGVELR